MALKSRTFLCPDCDGRFTLLLDDREPLPSHCSLCGSYVGENPEPILNFSRIGKAENQTLDKTYRQMETASAARAEEAAVQFGGTAADYANIKISNMKDNLREGDTSFIAPPSQEAAVMRGGTAPVAASDIAALRNNAIGATPQSMTSGFRPPSPGSVTLDKIRPGFSQRARQMAKAGQIASYAGK